MTKMHKNLLLSAFCLLGSKVSAAPLVYEGEGGVGKGKHIVFVANDHEYRSEETCPALAKILAKHHGFKCSVVFGLDEEGNILPGSKQMPDLDVLKQADFVVLFTRFLDLPEDQAQHIVDYLERGGPIAGMRTSTHAFNDQKGKWSILNFDYKGEDYNGGLGKQVFGNTWNKQSGQSHYGQNHREGGVYTAEESAKEHVILTGIESFYGKNGAYKSQPPADATKLVKVQVLKTFERSDNVNTQKPEVNAGWTRDSYTAPSGEKKDARVFYTSIGASEDFLDASSRRYFVNAAFWCMGMEKDITPELKVDIVGGFEPSAYMTDALYRINVKPADLADFNSSVMPKDAPFFLEKMDRVLRVLPARPQLEERVKALHPDVSFVKPAPKAKREKAKKSVK